MCNVQPLQFGYEGIMDTMLVQNAEHTIIKWIIIFVYKEYFVYNLRNKIAMQKFVYVEKLCY